MPHYTAARTCLLLPLRSGAFISSLRRTQIAIIVVFVDLGCSGEALSFRSDFRDADNYRLGWRPVVSSEGHLLFTVCKGKSSVRKGRAGRSAAL